MIDPNPYRKIATEFSRNGKPERVRTLPAYSPFPTEKLPLTIREYVRAGAAALGCDDAMIALPCLAALAGAIGYTRVIKLKGSWKEPVVLWTAVVADSGTLKSPAYDLAVRPILDIQHELVEEHRREVQRFNEATDRGEECPEPKPVRRIYASDTTLEKLVAILDDNRRGILVARDELAGWLTSFERYKPSSDLPSWLEFHRAGQVSVDRKGGDKKYIVIPHAAVSVTGTIQPSILQRQLDEKSFGAGLVARLFFAMPPERRKRWTNCDIGDEVAEGYARLLKDLLNLKFEDGRHGPRPYFLVLSPEAHEAWTQHYDRWAGEQTLVEGDLRAAFAKLEGGAARLAALCHICERVACDVDDRDPVTARSIDAGIALAGWFANEAERVYAMLAEDSLNRDRRKLIEFIRAFGGRMTTRQLQRSNSRKYPGSVDAQAALDDLVEAGEGHWLPPEAKQSGGWAVQVFELRSTHDTSDTRSDAPVAE